MYTIVFVNKTICESRTAFSICIRPSFYVVSLLGYIRMINIQFRNSVHTPLWAKSLVFQIWNAGKGSSELEDFSNEIRTLWSCSLFVHANIVGAGGGLGFVDRIHPSIHEVVNECIHGMLREISLHVPHTCDCEEWWTRAWEWMGEWAGMFLCVWFL